MSVQTCNDILSAVMKEAISSSGRVSKIVEPMTRLEPWNATASLPSAGAVVSSCREAMLVRLANSWPKHVGMAASHRRASVWLPGTANRNILGPAP